MNDVLPGAFAFGVFFILRLIIRAIFAPRPIDPDAINSVAAFLTLVVLVVLQQTRLLTFIR